MEPFESELTLFDRYFTGEALSGLGLALLLNLQLLETAQYAKVKVNLKFDSNHSLYTRAGRLYYDDATYQKLVS